MCCNAFNGIDIMVKMEFALYLNYFKLIYLFVIYRNVITTVHDIR